MLLSLNRIAHAMFAAVATAFLATSSLAAGPGSPVGTWELKASGSGYSASAVISFEADGTLSGAAIWSDGNQLETLNGTWDQSGTAISGDVSVSDGAWSFTIGTGSKFVNGKSITLKCSDVDDPSFKFTCTGKPMPAAPTDFSGRYTGSGKAGQIGRAHV